MSEEGGDVGFQYVKDYWFRYPDKVDYTIKYALDLFIDFVYRQTGIRTPPQIIDDYRPEASTSQHHLGRAVDTVWPDHDPLQINDLAVSSRLFSGIGIYYNDRNAVSHHFDTRTTNTPDHPATWGAYITHPYDQTSKQHVRLDEYTTMGKVIDLIKKKPMLSGLIIAGFLLFLILKRR